MSTPNVKALVRADRKSPLSKEAPVAGKSLLVLQGFKSGRLRVTPPQCQQAALGITDTIVGIGLPLPAAGAPPPVYAIDPNAATVSRFLIAALTTVPLVATVSGESADKQQEYLDKNRPALVLYGTAVILGAALADSRAVLGAVQRKYWQQIKQAIPAARGKGLFTADDQDLMEAAINELLGEEQKAKQAPVDRRAATRHKNLKHQANLAAMGDHGALLNTMIDLQEGKAVDPQQRAAAAEAYEELTQQQAGATGTAKAPRGAAKGPTIH